MKGPRELKRYMSILRSVRGKRRGNGVVSSACLDDLHLFKLEQDRKYRKSNRRPRDGYAGSGE
jgi:hypothetical protein